MKKFKLVCAIVAVLATTTVILQNTQPVTTKLLFFTVTIPNALTITLALLIGLIAGLLLALVVPGKRVAAKGAGQPVAAGKSGDVV